MKKIYILLSALLLMPFIAYSQQGKPIASITTRLDQGESLTIINYCYVEGVEPGKEIETLYIDFGETQKRFPFIMQGFLS